ncbi:MAG: D-3-phosphoglycerate dehydrogenase [Sphingobacteriales bacterium]
MKKHTYFIIDFDSTFTTVEALDELADIALSGQPQRDSVVEQIKMLTDQGMDGSISFEESLEKRVALLNSNKEHLEKLVKRLRKKVSNSFKRNREFFLREKDNIYIVSGGFKEFIVPVVKDYGVLPENVYANEFTYDKVGNIIGSDRSNPLAGPGGKVEVLQKLNLKGEIIVLGDGYTDYQLRSSGIADKFYAFTENIERELVTKAADHVTPSFDEFLHVNKLPMALSYPKNRIRVSFLGEKAEEHKKLFKKEGYDLGENRKVDIKGTSIIFAEEDTDWKKIDLSQTTRLKAIGILGKAHKSLKIDFLTDRGVAIFDDPKGKKSNVEFIPKRMIEFINKGTTSGSINFPSIDMEQGKSTHRMLHIHHNLPGMLAKLNKIMADHKINISGQFLKTNVNIGYAITDVDSKYDRAIIEELKSIAGTISFRILYT